MEDLKREWLRKRNTQHFSVSSVDGEINRNVGNFDFLIPPFPYPELQRSQYGLFKLKSAYIIGQTKTADGNTRASNDNDEDIGAFYVEISGVGIQSSMGSTITNSRIRGTNQFFIPNKDALCDLGRSGIFQAVSGGMGDDSEVSCSNPSGTMISVKVYDAEGNGTSVIGGNNTGDMNFILNFSIEMLDI